MSQKAIANIILDGDITKAIFSKLGIRPGFSFSEALISVVLEILVAMIRPLSMRNRKEEKKTKDRGFILSIFFHAPRMYELV